MDSRLRGNDEGKEIIHREFAAKPLGGFRPAPE